MENTVNAFTWKIGGEAGFGINSSGLLFTKYCMRNGLHAFEYSEYPSLIRGGHQTSQVSVGISSVSSEHYAVDLLLAMNKASVELHLNELSETSGIIYDVGQFKLSSPTELLGKKSTGVTFFGVPLTQIAVDLNGLNIFRNVVGIGASIALLKGNLDILFGLLAEEFGDKDPTITEMNKAAARAGYEYVQNHFEGLCETFSYKIEPRPVEKKLMVVSGNESLGLGAIQGGVTFYAGYPMTPSSTLLAFMAEHQYKYSYVVKHAEDEIAAVNMTIGASFAGARAMCATSGGGFSLMSEGIGLAAITETPLTIVDVQRPGPATGLPTWTDQGDLRFVLHAAQGEFLRVIIAPGDMEECFVAMQRALNWSEKYQIPAFVLSDKWLAESHQVVQVFDSNSVPLERGKLVLKSDELGSFNKWRADTQDYSRYSPTHDGVSVRTVPGVIGGVYLANSDEHDDHGYTNEEAENRLEQVDKRMMKLHSILNEMPSPIIYGNEFSSILLLGWGSIKGPVLEALKMVEEELDTTVAFMHVMYIWPFPKDVLKSIFDRYRRIILIENNSQAQLGGLIAQMTGRMVHERWLKYDGRPFWPEELKSKIVGVIEGK